MVAAQSLSTGHLVYVRTRHECLWCSTWFARLAHPRRSCSAFAGRDSLANHSLGLIALGFARLLNWICIWPFTLNSQLLTFNSFPRFRADANQTGLHDHPSLTIGGIRDRRFQFCTLLADQRPRMRLATGNIRNCAIHAAAMVMVPELEAILSPPFNARSARRNAHRF